MKLWFKKGNADAAKPKRSKVREWANAAVFAIVVASLIRTFAAEAYTIPSGSMEGSLLINDHLFVSKMAYGPRIPMTPLAVPLVHNTMPLAGGKSYTDAVQWRYRRLPGFGHVQRNDIVVFNAPGGDSAIAEEPEMDYYQACRVYGRDAIMQKYTIVSHPVDKRENLIKRCIAVAGDVVTIKDAIVYVNGQQAALYPHSKLTYIVRSNGMQPILPDEAELVQKVSNSVYAYTLPNDQLAAARKAQNVVSVELYMKDAAGAAPAEPGDWVFPLDTVNYKWNRDNYGPVTIPKAGATVALNAQNISLYRRLISLYEGNTLEEQNGHFIINGKQATSYTFKMDYYWMMGDNRHNSLDSRYWGFVPEDHIVGKAWFTYYSYGPDGPLADMHWSRLFKGMSALEQ